MSVKQLIGPANRAFTSNGFPAPGATVTLYLSGTTTLANFYADTGLITSLGPVLTADGAGRFETPAYQDEFTAFRVIYRDATGAQLDDIDPFFFGYEGPRGVQGIQGDVAKVLTRTALSQIAVGGQASGLTRYLVEAGYEGIFVWNTANVATKVTADTEPYSYVPPASGLGVSTTGSQGAWIRHQPRAVNSRARLASSPTTDPIMFDGSPWTFDSSNLFVAVTADTAQGIYVASALDVTGAGGAWVRQFTGPADAKWFGVIGDGTTDDATALQCWLDYGGALFLPAGKYRSSQRLIIRKCVHLNGASYGFDGRIVGYSNMPGSKIAFDAGVGGLDIQPQWVGTDWSATTPTQEGASHSVLENFGLIGGGGATATGVHCRVPAYFRNVHVLTFSGKGFDLPGGASAGDNGESGSTDQATLEHCHAISNGGHGFHLRGIDANVIKLDTCNALLNGGWGFYDEAEFANLYLNCHAASNALGSYGSPGYAITPHTYINCYVEGGTGANCDISTPCVVVGGELTPIAATAAYNAHSGGPLPGIIDGSIYSTVRTLHITWNDWDGASLLSTDHGVIAGHSTYGTICQGLGGDFDVACFNQSGVFGAGLVANTTNWKAAGNLIAGGVIQGAVYAVAALPVAPALGTRAIVNNATVTTFASAVVGGGINLVPVYYDGTWRIG